MTKGLNGKPIRANYDEPKNVILVSLWQNGDLYQVFFKYD